MSNFGRSAASGMGILLLVLGLPALGLGFILRETGLFGLILLAGGGYVALEGLFLVIEARFRGRGD